MAKVGISTVQPGQATEVEQSVAGSPVQDLKERVPQAESSGFDELIDPNAGVDQDLSEAIGAGVEAGIAAEEQVAVERIAPVGERYRDISRIDKWNTKQTKEADEADGGIGVELLILLRSMKQVV